MIDPVAHLAESRVASRVATIREREQRQLAKAYGKLQSEIEAAIDHFVETTGIPRREVLATNLLRGIVAPPRPAILDLFARHAGTINLWAAGSASLAAGIVLATGVNLLIAHMPELYEMLAS